MRSPNNAKSTPFQPSALSANLSNPGSEKLQPDTGSTLTQKLPQSITLPMPVTVKDRYLEVRQIGTDAVITVIEVLSPKNKQKGKGRTTYEKKRALILSSLWHLIEIDLLRGNLPMTIIGKVHSTDYRIVVSQ